MDYKKGMNFQMIQDEESYRVALGRKDGYLLIVGESEFEHYLTCPVAEIQADLRAVSLLMLDLESLSWHGHLYEGDLVDVSIAGYEASLECGEFQPGDRVERGEITAGIWLSPTFSEFEIADQVRGVLHGEITRIPGVRAGCGEDEK